MQYFTLDQLMFERVIPDMWTRNTLGSVLIKKPNIFSNSGAVSVDGRVSYGADFSAISRCFDNRRQIPTPAVSIWKDELRDYGLVSEVVGSDLKATLYHKHFPEAQAADIINSVTPVISAQDIKRDYGSAPFTRDIFAIGTKHGLSDKEIAQRVKTYYTALNAAVRR